MEENSQDANNDNVNDKGSEGLFGFLKGAEKAHPWAKAAAFWGMVSLFVWCLVVSGALGLSHDLPFQADANFALFAAFIVVAGAIERLIEPMLVYLPPNEKGVKADAPAKNKEEAEAENERVKADRLLLAYVIAMAAGIALSSMFGLYFLEAIGVKIGVITGSGSTEAWEFFGTGDKWLRGMDIFVTALIITGGTKPLHDMITSIEKKKDAPAKVV